MRVEQINDRSASRAPERAAHGCTARVRAPGVQILTSSSSSATASTGKVRCDELKSEAADAVKRIIAAFNATVGVRIDAEGKPLPRPTVRVVHSDREGKLVSHYFRAFRADARLHHTTSPPHDHDLNPIAERIIGSISETATAIRASSGLPARFWPGVLARSH